MTKTKYISRPVFYNSCKNKKIKRNTALECVISEAGEPAILLLKALHQNLDVKLKSRYGEVIRDTYLKTCLTRLSRALRESSRLVVKRCVYLLKEFLRGFMQKRKEITDCMFEIEPDKEFKHPNFQLALSSNQTIGKKKKKTNHSTACGCG